MDLDKVLSATAEDEVEYCGQKAKFTYYSQKTTLEHLQKFRELYEADGEESAVISRIVEVIASWDVKLSGEPVPIKFDEIRRLVPMPLLLEFVKKTSGRKADPTVAAS